MQCVSSGMYRSSCLCYHQLPAHLATSPPRPSPLRSPQVRGHHACIRWTCTCPRELCKLKIRELAQPPLIVGCIPSSMHAFVLKPTGQGHRRWLMLTRLWCLPQDGFPKQLVRLQQRRHSSSTAGGASAQIDREQAQRVAQRVRSRKQPQHQEPGSQLLRHCQGEERHR
jgi:hypothetical protein